ncbi:MAG: YidC/Oxa1 family membrane protein insertase [Oscillospiraceae bacterium]|nr:YidC/Oxa1 family membrane protein insertase [Oscillospiraceae bacterium]
MDFIAVPFGYVLEFLYNFTNNYGLALLIFSLFVKILLLYPSAKSKKSTMKTSRLQPQLKELELAYGNDKQKYQEEVQKLYKEEGINPMGGCLWALLPLLILFPLYSAIREPLNYLMHIDADTIEKIKEAYMAANGLEKVDYYWQFAAAQNIQTYGAGLVDAGIQNLNFSFLGIDLGLKPTWKIWTLTSWAEIGGALIPLVSGLLNFLSMLVSQKMNNSVISNAKGEKDTAAAQTAATGKGMMYIMPLISVFFGYMWPLGMSIYWLSQSALGIIQDYFLTKHYRKVYDAEDAVRREKAAQKAAEEAEKERIRAAKRAANPDGITANTSKKKQQLREKQDREAAAKDYEAKKRAVEGLAPEQAAEILGGEANRPYARGRAYQPDHYKKEEE